MREGRLRQKRMGRVSGKPSPRPRGTTALTAGPAPSRLPRAAVRSRGTSARRTSASITRRSRLETAVRGSPRPRASTGSAMRPKRRLRGAGLPIQPSGTPDPHPRGAVARPASARHGDLGAASPDGSSTRRPGPLSTQTVVRRISPPGRRACSVSSSAIQAPSCRASGGWRRRRGGN